MTTPTSKWIWMMDWCLDRKLPPGELKVWEMAEEAYLEYLKGLK